MKDVVQRFSKHHLTLILRGFCTKFADLPKSFELRRRAHAAEVMLVSSLRLAILRGNLEQPELAARVLKI
jgi:hypothetical protein